MDEAGKRHGTSRFTVMMILGLILWGLATVCCQHWEQCWEWVAPSVLTWINPSDFPHWMRPERYFGSWGAEVHTSLLHIMSCVKGILFALVFLSAAHVMRIKGAGAGLFMAGVLHLYYQLFFFLHFWTGCDAPVAQYIGQTYCVVWALVPFLIPRQVLRNAWLVAMKWGWFVCLVVEVCVACVTYAHPPRFWEWGVPCVVRACLEWITYLSLIVHLTFWVLFVIDVGRNDTGFKAECMYSFEGRMGRRQFWPLYAGILVSACVLVASWPLPREGGEEGRYWLGQIFAYLATFFSMPLRVRRLHDRGMSGRWLVLFDIGLIAVMVFALCGVAGIGQIASSVFLIVASVIGFGAKFVEFIFLCLKGTKGENRYGPNPALPLNSSHVIAPPTA